MKYKVGDKVRIKSLDWYNENKDEYGNIDCGEYLMIFEKSQFCGKIVTISSISDVTNSYKIEEDNGRDNWTDEMIEGLVEEEIDIIPKFGEYSDNTPLDVPTMTTEFVKDHGLPCPDGYIFKDENDNIINAQKIVLEKVNTLKIQSNHMETETHRGYYTTEEDTTNKSKKLAWFSFFDSNFADKVELDLSNRELIQEDGKWFVVKKKKEYLKTYEECCKVLNYCCNPFSVKTTHKEELIRKFQFLLLYRDAYWKIAGEEMGLGKPWEPDWNSLEPKYTISLSKNSVKLIWEQYYQRVFAFPIEEMRDAFYEAFKELIEECKELL